MADYQDIRGLRVKYLSADPSNIADGEVWYNSTSGTLKTQGLSAATSSGGAITTGRYAIGSAGTLTAGLITGGDLYPAPAPARGSNATETYDGSSWTNGGNLGTARGWVAACGTQTAVIGSGGATHPGSVSSSATETYNGTSWTGGTSVPTITEAANQFGVQTASIFIDGGTPAGYPNSAYTQTGGAWTSIPSLNNPNSYGAMTNGTTTAGIRVGGGHPVQDHVEEWNGTAWSNSTAFPATIYNSGGNSVGTSTAMAVAGGDGPTTQITIWDGSTWAISPASLATAREGRPGSAGTSTAFYVAGGPSSQTATEEYSKAPAVQTITVS